MFPVFKYIRERSIAKTLLDFFQRLVKSFKNLLTIDLLITSISQAFFLISSMVLGLLDQLQIFF